MKIKTLLIVLFTLVLICVAGAGVYVVYLKKVDYEEQILDAESQNYKLQGELDSIGEMVAVYQTAYDVSSGTEVKESDITSAEVPAKVAGAYVQDPNDIIGKYYKLNIPEGTPLLDSMVFDFPVSEDMRYLDVVCDEVPIGLEVDDYVDVRISFTFGQDFISMTHKRVAAIYGKTVKLIVDQRDVYTYESMKVDKSIYSGTKIYAIEYLEGGSQTEASNYYPMRTEVLATLVQDPNINSDLSSFTLVNRAFLEKQLANADLVEDIAKSKKDLLRAFADANSIYEDVVKDAKKEAEKAEKEAKREAERAAKKAEEDAEAANADANAGNDIK